MTECSGWVRGVLVLSVAVLSQGCVAGRYAVAKPQASGTGSYEGVTIEDKQRMIPIALLNDSRTYAAARNCAQAYNAALDSASGCTAGTWFFRMGAIGAGTLAAVATGVSASLGAGEDAAKRNWQWTALTSSIIAGSLGAVELFTNCAERREMQSRVAVRRGAALSNAAHLVSCAQRRSPREWLLAVAGAGTKATADSVKASLDAKKDARDTLVELSASADATAAAIAKKALAELHEGTVETCADSRTEAERKAAAERGETLRDYYLDAAHRTLTECLNSEYLGFGEAAPR